MPSYEEDLSEFERRNAQVLGISTDQVHTQRGVGEVDGRAVVPAPLGQLAVRLRRAASTACCAATGICERAIFVVDKQGKIAYIDIHDIGEQPPTDKIMAALDKLK